MERFVPKEKAVDHFEDLRLARESSSKEIVNQLITTPKKQAPEGSYMKVFATYLDDAFTQSLGKDWQANRYVQRVLSSLDSKGAPTEYSFWGSLYKKGGALETQPLESLKMAAEGKFKAKTREWDKRDLEVKKEAEQRVGRKLTKGASGNKEEMGISSEPAFGTSIQTEAQSPLKNVLAQTPMERVMSGFTLALRQNRTPTAQEALTDASRFFFDFKKAYETARKTTKTKKGKEGFFLEPKQKTDKYFNVEKKMEITPEMRFTVNEASSITNKIIADLSKKRIQIGTIDKPKKILADIKKERKEALSSYGEAKKVVKEELAPRYQAVKKEGGIPNYEVFKKDGGKMTLEKIEELNSFYRKKKGYGKELKTEEEWFMFYSEKYRDLLQSVGEYKRAEAILRSDYPIAASGYKNLKGALKKMDKSLKKPNSSQKQ